MNLLVHQKPCLGLVAFCLLARFQVLILMHYHRILTFRLDWIMAATCYKNFDCTECDLDFLVC